MQKKASTQKTLIEQAIAALGISSEHFLPLILPYRYNDLKNTAIIEDFSDLDSLVGQKAFILCRLNRVIKTPDYREKKAKKVTTITILDRNNRSIFASTFAPSTVLLNQLKAEPVICLFGTVGEWNGNVNFNNIEYVNKKWIGFVQPVYPGRTNVISPHEILSVMELYLAKSLPLAAEFIRKELSLLSIVDEKKLLAEAGGEQFQSLIALMKVIHLPESIEQGEFAQQIIRRIAALSVCKKTKINKIENEKLIIKDFGKTVATLINRLPEWIKLTDDQKIVLREIAKDILSGFKMHRLLTGDVGTGKSIPIAIAAAAMAKSNGVAVILLPNAPLSTQMQNDIKAWWPEIPVSLVISGVKNNFNKEAKIFIGTTALLDRLDKNIPINLIIVDEQQKLGVEQREKLRQTQTHYLEASATPIPRSLALAQYGDIPVSTLKQGHTNKTIRTKLIHKDKQAKQLLKSKIDDVLNAGWQVLLIYPLAENITSKQLGRDGVKSVDEAALAWESLYPGRVEKMHGRMRTAEKISAVEALKTEKKDILCSTTAVEVGLNIPKLRLVIVVHPERLGLSTLHQIRGRLCRHGGEGDFIMYLPAPVSEKSLERLDAMVKHQDGFLLAQVDMKLRGVGDISNEASSEQSGHMSVSFLVNQKLVYEDFEWLN